MNWHKNWAINKEKQAIYVWIYIHRSRMVTMISKQQKYVFSTSNWQQEVNKYSTKLVL